MKVKIKEKEDQLFKLCRLEHDRFVSDGLIDGDSYFSARIRILLLPKGVNDRKGGGWDLRCVLCKNPSYSRTWNNVARWSYGLLDEPLFVPCSKVPKPNLSFRKKWLSPLAAVNVKKVGGGGRANRLEIIDYIKRYKNLLQQQLELYRPNVTICCGTSEFLPLIFNPLEEYNLATTSNGTCYANSSRLGIVIYY